VESKNGNLTINAGLRWEINTPATEAAGRVYVPDRAINGSEGPVTFVKADSFWKTLQPGCFRSRLVSPGVGRRRQNRNFEPATASRSTPSRRFK